MGKSRRRRGRGRHPSHVGHLGMAVVSTFMANGQQPPRIAIHHDDGSWTFTCGTATEVDHFILWHAEHVFDQFGDDIFHPRELPRGFIAERDERGDDWSITPYEGD